MHVYIQGTGEGAQNIKNVPIWQKKLSLRTPILSERVQCAWQTDPPPARPRLRHLFPSALGGALVPDVPR